VVYYWGWLVVLYFHPAQGEHSLLAEVAYPNSNMQSAGDLNIGTLYECVPLDRPSQPVLEVSGYGKDINCYNYFHHTFSSSLFGQQGMELDDVLA
jgi:hypothetical protein